MKKSIMIITLLSGCDGVTPKESMSAALIGGFILSIALYCFVRFYIYFPGSLIDEVKNRIKRIKSWKSKNSKGAN